MLLDLMLPEINGLDVLKRIRSSNEKLPAILLTAKNDVKDKVAGLDLGANDYEYEYEIDAYTGEVREQDRDRLNEDDERETSQGSGNGTQAAAQGMISAEEA